MVSFIDRLAGLGLSPRYRSAVVFPEGWGDRLSLELFDRLTGPVSSAPTEVMWEPKTELRGMRRRRGLFRSPLADAMPHPARVVPVEVTTPALGTKQMVILLPAWNEEGFDRRRALADMLAERGIGSATFEIPLYGQRRVISGPATPIRSVADFALMGVGAVSEAHALLDALAPEYPEMGVAGFSMGGNLAALVSARSVRPLATALMAAPHSPRPVYLDGVLSRAIAWKALGGRQARPDLARLLDGISVTAFPPADHHRSAVAVAARGDGFVPAHAVQTLVDHWPGAELRWLDGGHATLRLRYGARFVAAITDAFRRIAAQRGSRS